LKDGNTVVQLDVAVTGSLVVIFPSVSLMGEIELFTPFTLSYSLNPVIIHPGGAFNSGARVALPGVGVFMTLGFALIVGTTIAFLLNRYRNVTAAGSWGHWLLRGSLVMQAIATGILFYRLKTMGAVGTLIGADQYYTVGKTLAGREAAGQSVENLVNVGANWLQSNGGSLVMDVRGNPVEVAAVISLLVVTLFLVLFSIRTEQIRASLPPLEKIDSMTYKTVGVAFAGLAILLVTGAIWANESWGRYWGWDAKETGALVAWLAYAGYLHTRMAHGWTGRRSAYFALVGFLLVIFTYLGVSYILPGLHSYA